MTTKVSVGLCRKRGLRDFGSVGASCNIEIELGDPALDGDPEAFRQRVRRAYAACRESVEDELSRDESGSAVSSSRPSENGPDSQHGSSGRNGQSRGATQSQVRAIKGIAARNRIDLGPLIGRFGVGSADELSISQASSLIDELTGKPSEIASS
jgi:hypothetical protein